MIQRRMLPRERCTRRTSAAETKALGLVWRGEIQLIAILLTEFNIEMLLTRCSICLGALHTCSILPVACSSTIRLTITAINTRNVALL